MAPSDIAAQNTPPSFDSTIGNIATSLRQISTWLAYIALHNPDPSLGEDDDPEERKKNHVAVLRSLDYDRQQIAAVLQMTVNAVNIQLSRQGLTRVTKKARQSKKG